MFSLHRWVVILSTLFSMFHVGIARPNDTFADKFDSVPMHTYNKAWRHKIIFSRSHKVPVVPRFRFLDTNTCHEAPFKQIDLQGPTTCINGQQATFLTFRRRKCRGSLPEALSFNGVRQRNQCESKFQSFKIICGDHLEAPATAMQYLLDLYDPSKPEFIRGIFGLALRTYRRGYRTHLPKVMIFCLVLVLYHGAVGYVDLHLNESIDFDFDIIGGVMDCLLTCFECFLTVFAILRHPDRRIAWFERINAELEFGQVGIRERHRHQQDEWEHED